MKRLLCLIFGHKRPYVPVDSGRRWDDERMEWDYWDKFMCSRCGYVWELNLWVNPFDEGPPPPPNPK